jgi:hypothetical protein
MTASAPRPLKSHGGLGSCARCGGREGEGRRWSLHQIGPSSRGSRRVPPPPGLGSERHRGRAREGHQPCACSGRATAAEVVSVLADLTADEQGPAVGSHTHDRRGPSTRLIVTGAPDAMSQIRTAWSALVAAIRRPSGCTATARTSSECPSIVPKTPSVAGSQIRTVRSSPAAATGHLAYCRR